MSPQVGPSLRRRQLAEQLTSLRDEAGLLTAQVAEHLRVDRSLVSHYEAGRRLPKYAELVMMLQLYGASDRLEVLGELLERANDRGWWQTAGLPPWIQPYLGAEDDATRVRCWALELVPGLVQTADYAASILLLHNTDPALTSRMVTARMKRQQRIIDGHVTVEVICSEALLYRTAGMMKEGPEQLQRLANPGEGITIRVLPFAAGGHRSLSGSYTLLDYPPAVSKPIGYREGTFYGELVDSPRTVSTLEEIWKYQNDAALSAAESSALIARKFN